MTHKPTMRGAAPEATGNPNARYCADKGFTHWDHDCAHAYCQERRATRKAANQLTADLMTRSQPMREILGNGSEVKFFGVDWGREPAKHVEGVWHRGVFEITPPQRPRRPAFPNPEPMAWRPKL